MKKKKNKRINKGQETDQKAQKLKIRMTCPKLIKVLSTKKVHIN